MKFGPVQGRGCRFFVVFSVFETSFPKLHDVNFVFVWKKKTLLGQLRLGAKYKKRNKLILRNVAHVKKQAGNDFLPGVRNSAISKTVILKMRRWNPVALR